MQTFPRGGALIIGPGVILPIDISGNFFRVLAASGPLVVAFDDDGQSAEVSPGLAITREKPFTRLRLSNDGAVAVSGVVIAVGFGRYDDNRLQYNGGVAIRGGGSAFGDTIMAVGAAAVQLLAANPGRTSGVIRAGLTDLWLGPTNAVAAAGPATIPAGGALTIGHTAAVYAIRGGAAADAGAYEEVI